MAQPTNAIAIIATETLGADGFTNKELPNAPVTNLGFSKQSFAYQHANYLHNNHGEWIKYINEEQIPDEALARTNADSDLQDSVNVINNTTIPAETAARTTADGFLQGSLNLINNTTIPAVSSALAIHGVGYNQTWQDMRTLRGNGITYTNDTGKPIFAIVVVNDFNITKLTVVIDGVSAAVDAEGTASLEILIPSGSEYSFTYAATGSNAFNSWLELR